MKKEYNIYEHPIKEFIGTIIATIVCIPIFIILYLIERVIK